ncbi:MAG: hypothetical protein SPH11_01185 [Lentihominibacter sp.]|uniref:hypothetical protein n=1 Tax=Lentihominibacter sp. TaxID=2944216 RepID=UPI002A912667|nr:hypothetical protein [Lentihominibacter sp.]MDY5286352.1 hypothetical protein [Lentihominibacter sp.]
MENKKIETETVIANEKEMKEKIRELSEVVAEAVELSAREAFYTLHDEYEYEDRLHVFNSYVNLFEELKEISPAHAITLIDIILIDHGYSFIPEQLRALCNRNKDAIDRFNDSFKKCAIEAFMDELDMADAEYEDEFEDDEDSCECDCGSCDSCKCGHECEGVCQGEKIDFTFKVGNQIAEGTLRPCECKCCDDKGCDEDE